MNEIPNIAQYIRDTRLKLALTQTDFGRFLGVAPRTVASLENGNSKPSREQMEILIAMNQAIVNQQLSPDQVSLGEIIAKSLLIGGVAWGLYKILSLAFQNNSQSQSPKRI